MAALMDSYQRPEGMNFSPLGHYSDSPQVLSDEGMDPGEVVKSKPRGKMSSYQPLINEAPCVEELHEDVNSDDRRKEIKSHLNYQHGSQKPPSEKESREQSGSGDALPPNGTISEFVSLEVHVESGIGDADSSDKKTYKFDLGSRATKKTLETKGESEDRGLEDSTTALLRRYTMDRNGRPASIHLGPSGEIVSSGGLSDVLLLGHRKCSVSLEEDSVNWRYISRKEAKLESLYLSDVYAVTQGTPSQILQTPLTPHSPAPRSHPLAPAASSTTPSSPSRTHNHSTNQRRARRQTSTSSLSSSNSNCSFTLHALKSQSGSVGQLVKVSFRCPTPETAQTWVEQITHQMQDFGNRPRKLYVVINPASRGGHSEKIWHRIHQIFQIASIHTDILTTQHRFHAREQIQSLDLAQYDGIVAVGGDGLFNEVLNGLLIQTQHQSGVNLRRSRFMPVTPSIRLGIIPTGFNNSISRSLFGCKSPMVAAAQIMLGCSSPVDISSVTQNNTLLLFSAGPMSYGFWSDTVLLSRDINWLGPRRFDIATLYTLLSHRHFEAEIQFVPVEDPEEIIQKKEKCFNRCQKCSNFDNSADSPSGASEKGASVMAAYNEVDRVDKSQWKTITGHFSSIMACPHTCCSFQAPHGISPYGHVGNGCTDLVMLTRCSTFAHAKWVFKQRKKSSSQFDHPYVHIRRVKEFRFREIMRPSIGSHGGDSSRSSVDPDDANSVDNLVTEPDDDEVTNARAGARTQNQGDRRQRSSSLHTSQWNIDGDELPRADIEVRVHRHLVSVFARGLEPLDPESPSSSSVDMEEEEEEEEN